MGGAPKAPQPQPVPEAPKPIDYEKMADASIRVAKESLAAEEEAVKRLYPQYIGMQFDTADKLAGKLDNQYLERVRGVVDEELAAASTPNTIEAELQRQAETELALGRSLTPEQERAATQQARAGMAARGLGAGTGALAAEVLNRDAYASARETDRRAFANQANQIDLARRQRRTGLAGLYGDLDPYRAAIGPAFGLGSTTLGQTSGQVRDIYGGSLQTAGGVATFNTNMAASNRNTILNNNAALQAAYIANPPQNPWIAGITGIVGGVNKGIEAYAGSRCWVARAAWGEASPRWIKFRDSMLTHAPEWFIAAYDRHGEALARHINTPARRAFARLILATLQRLWTPANPKLQPA